MREILFRGKRKDNGKWIQGDYQHFHIDNDTYVYIGRWGEEMRSVKPETVGQFIELTDKNGTKIFEGDVIRFHKFRDEPDWVGVISYDQCQYVVTGKMPLAYHKPKNGEGFYSHFEVAVIGIDKARITVIGNIHDNPELLEVG
jgi:uncharacterized phage protein (TIGR01671 family)